MKINSELLSLHSRQIASISTYIFVFFLFRLKTWPWWFWIWLNVKSALSINKPEWSQCCGSITFFVYFHIVLYSWYGEWEGWKWFLVSSIVSLKSCWVMFLLYAHPFLRNKTQQTRLWELSCKSSVLGYGGLALLTGKQTFKHRLTFTKNTDIVFKNFRYVRTKHAYSICLCDEEWESL